MELGQMVFAKNTQEYEMPLYAIALFQEVISEIERVYWNVNQKQFDAKYGDPEHGIPGITIRCYWWGDEDAPEASLPNFEAAGLEISWYKYVGRGMTSSRDLSPSEWVDWFNKVIGIVRSADVKLGKEGVS